MSEEKHTWISRMKMEGNEMADQEAKQAASEQEEDTEFPMEHIVTFRHNESGIRSSLKGMIQWARELFKRQRRKRLTKPADPTKSQHGQGMYMTKASQGRSLITKRLWKGQNGMAKHRDWIRQYMIEAVQTRQFKEQHKQKGKAEVHGWCPVCAVTKGIKVAQTKEHLYGGECQLTSKTVQKWEKEIEEKLRAKLGSAEEVTAIKNIWEKETKKIRYEARNIEQHKFSPALIGVWQNQTFLGVRDWMIQKKDWTEAESTKLAVQICKWKMEQGAEIHKLLAKNREALTETPTMQEIQKLEEWISKQEQKTKLCSMEVAKRLVEKEKGTHIQTTKKRKITEAVTKESSKTAAKQRWKLVTGQVNPRKDPEKTKENRQPRSTIKRRKEAQKEETVRNRPRSTLKRRRQENMPRSIQEQESVERLQATGRMEQPRSTQKRRRIQTIRIQEQENKLEKGRVGSPPQPPEGPTQENPSTPLSGTRGMEGSSCVGLSGGTPQPLQTPGPGQLSGTNCPGKGEGRGGGGGQKGTTEPKGFGRNGGDPKPVKQKDKGPGHVSGPTSMQKGTGQPVPE
jgi:hypothetical protein